MLTRFSQVDGRGRDGHLGQETGGFGCKEKKNRWDYVTTHIMVYFALEGRGGSISGVRPAAAAVCPEMRCLCAVGCSATTSPCLCKVKSCVSSLSSFFSLSLPLQEELEFSHAWKLPIKKGGNGAEAEGDKECLISLSFFFSKPKCVRALSRQRRYERAKQTWREKNPILPRKFGRGRRRRRGRTLPPLSLSLYRYIYLLSSQDTCVTA